MSILPISVLLHQPALDHEKFSAQHELEALLRSTVRGDVLFDLGSRALYAADASNYRQMPVGVITPRDAADVEAAMAACRATGAAVLARGAGTSLAGQCTNVAVVFDYSRYMRGLTSIDPGNKLAVVEPGIVLDRLREAAEVYQLTYAPDPATHSRCTLGGMIGNNSCGVHGLLGGKVVDNVESLDVVLYDGTKLTVGPTPPDQLEALIRGGGRVGCTDRVCARTAASVSTVHGRASEGISGPGGQDHHHGAGAGAGVGHAARVGIWPLTGPAGNCEVRRQGLLVSAGPDAGMEAAFGRGRTEGERVR